MKKISQLNFNNSYARLPDAFFSRVKPTPFNNTHLVSVNKMVADLLEIDIHEFARHETLAMFSGHSQLPDMQPIAQCYAGHQFGGYVPRLGDGRAILLGEIQTDNYGKWDLQVKGSGLTPYSRDGDGRAVLRSTIREYLCSEAMHGLGIPTSRALCIIGSDEEVYRERIETGAMLLRAAPSHVRFGTFEYFYYKNQFDEIQTLTDYVIDENFDWLKNSNNKYITLLDEVITRTAKLIAQWQAIGFSHGVMNTDNMSILGITIDYGPFGFMEAYDPGYICNHSDHHGRYAFNQQPDIGLFNLSCFAQAILPVLGIKPEENAEIAKQSLRQYGALFTRHYADQMRTKLGLDSKHSDDPMLTRNLLDLMHQDKVDYTIFFRRLCRFSTQNDSLNHPLRDLFIQREAFDNWAAQYKLRLQQEQSNDQTRNAQMKKINPKYILRNYMAEKAIRMAEEEHDYSEIDLLLELLQSPFSEQPEHEVYAGFPPEWAQHISVSCSS